MESKSICHSLPSLPSLPVPSLPVPSRFLYRSLTPSTRSSSLLLSVEGSRLTSSSSRSCHHNRQKETDRLREKWYCVGTCVKRQVTAVYPQKSRRKQTSWAKEEGCERAREEHRLWRSACLALNASCAPREDSGVVANLRRQAVHGMRLHTRGWCPPLQL